MNGTNDIIVLDHPFGPGEAVGGAQVRVDNATDAMRERETINIFSWFRPDYKTKISKDTF